MLALTGTPVNVIVSTRRWTRGSGAFGFFEFALVGVPLLLGTMGIVVLFGQRLLPDRSGRAMPSDLSRHARTLIEQYRLADGIFKLRVRAGIAVRRARSPAAVDLTELSRPELVERPGGRRSGPLRRRRAFGGRRPHRARGRARRPRVWRSDQASRLPRGGSQPATSRTTLFNRASGLAEVVIPPRSGMVGQKVFPGMVTESGDLIILAVQRRGADQGPDETVLAAGDTLLLQGTWKALDEHLADPDVLVVDSPDLVRRQAVPMGVGAKEAIAVLLGMVALLATGLVPSAIAGLRACAPHGPAAGS